MPQLTEAQIIELGKKTGNQINARSEAELFEPEVRAEIHLGMVVVKDAILNSTITEVQRVVPEGVDDSF